MIEKRLAQLRKLMEENGYEAYLIPTGDYHGSEYIADHFKTREYMSGFTGSAGTLVVTAKKAGLWVDSRYYIQGAQEIKGTEIQLYKDGLKETVSIADFLKQELEEGDVVGADMRMLSAAFCQKMRKDLSPNGILFDGAKDLVNDIWTDRPDLPQQPLTILDECYAGKSAEKKLEQVRKILRKEKIGWMLLTAPDEIMWLLNIRGSDIEFNPVALSYMIVSQDKAILFISKKKTGGKIGSYLKEIVTEIRPYEDIEAALIEFAGQKVLLDPNQVNAVLYDAIPKKDIVERLSLVMQLKAIKNSTEIKNLRKAHLLDGIALTKLIYETKKDVREGKHVTECSVAKRADELRKQVGAIGPSFGTIAGYASNGAICHYEPSEATDLTVQMKSFLLVDSGGQYLEGTTDVTRTFTLGNATAKEKQIFTRVLQGMLDLSMQVFPEGTNGRTLDKHARKPLQSDGYDYGHGTGHGIGYYLCVHEDPVRISTKKSLVPIQKGMVLSNEPGCYLEGEFGVRTEQQMVCLAKGDKLCFEILTLAPIELDAIDVSLLTKKQKDALNAYHQTVYKKIAPHLTADEKAWLKTATRKI